MQRYLFVTIFYIVVTFTQSYSYNRPSKGNHNVDVAQAENEFDTPDVDSTINAYWYVPGPGYEVDITTVFPR